MTSLKPAGSGDWPRDPDQVRAADIDVTVPAAGRIYDALLGGKDNYRVDRDAAAELERLLPGTTRLARDNRDLLIRATAYLAKHRGIRQFLDIGTGLPAEGAIHGIARRFVPDARVVYADHDPVAVAHGRALLACGDPNTLMVHADLRNPEALLGNPRVRSLLDFRKPIALFLVAVTHFLADEDDPAAVLAFLCSYLVPGSAVVLTHVTPGTAEAAEIQAGVAVYERSGGVHVRGFEELAGWFTGADLELVPPGLVPVSQWRPGLATELDLPQFAYRPDTQALPYPKLGGLAAVGRVPDRPPLP